MSADKQQNHTVISAGISNWLLGKISSWEGCLHQGSGGVAIPGTVQNPCGSGL